jgi:hypothetical protein
MGKHAVSAGPEGRAARRELRARRQANAWRLSLCAVPVMIASGLMDQTDVPWYFHPFLVGFGALVPLTAIGLLGWAAGGGPDGTGSWIVTAAGWSFMISACAALLMITRAITVRSSRRPAWLARHATARPST